MLFNMLSLIYFIGLMILSISIGSLYIREYAFIMIGSGAILYAVFVGILSYLNKGQSYEYKEEE